MFYNTKMEALSGSMERYIFNQQQHRKPYKLYQGDELVFESIHLEEIQEEIEEILEEQGIEIDVSFDEGIWSRLQQLLNIKVVR